MKDVIYKITHKDSGKSYIGLSKDFRNRMNMHKYLSKAKNPAQHIHRAIKKYGWDNFDKEIIEKNVENLAEREIFFIKEYDSYENGYNMTNGGENNHGYEYGEHHSNQIKKAFSVIEDNGKSKGYNIAVNNMVLKRKSYEGNSNPFYGKTHSEKSKEKMRKPKSNTENMKKSEKTKKKMSESMQGKKNAKGKTWKQIRGCCIYCKGEFGLSNLKNYHGDNCNTKAA